MTDREHLCRWLAQAGPLGQGTLDVRWEGGEYDLSGWCDYYSVTLWLLEPEHRQPGGAPQRVRPTSVNITPEVCSATGRVYSAKMCGYAVKNAYYEQAGIARELARLCGHPLHTEESGWVRL